MTDELNASLCPHCRFPAAEGRSCAQLFSCLELSVRWMKQNGLFLHPPSLSLREWMVRLLITAPTLSGWETKQMGTHR